MLRKKPYLVLLLLWLVFTGCRKGIELENQPPATKLSLNRINLDSGDRLNSLVQLQWFGFDDDGFVVGYEYSLDNFSWTFTTVQDTTFRFSTSGGNTGDINFYVRAIDNEGAKDPNPAFLRIPIKNTPPTLAIDESFFRPDTLLAVVSLQWIATDLDGDETIDSIFVKANNGPWTSLNRRANMVRILPDDFNAIGSVSSTLFSGIAQSPDFRITGQRTEPIKLEGLVLNGVNTLYVKVKDQSGEESKVDTSKQFFLQRINHSILRINAHINPDATPVYTTVFNNASINSDFINVFNYQAANQIRFWNYDFDLLIAQYDKIFWYASGTSSFFMEVTAPIFESYLNLNKKLLMAVQLQGIYSNSSRLFAFTPMDSLASKTQQQRLDVFPGMLATPLIAGYDTLEHNSTFGLSDLAPFYTNPLAQPFYEAEYFKIGNWNPPTTIAARAFTGNGRTNLIFFSVDIYTYNGRPQALSNLFDRIMTNEFNW